MWVAAFSALVLACAWMLVAGSASAGARASSCSGTGLRPNAANVRTVDTAVLCLIDRIRAAHGLRPLRTNRELRGVAASQVIAMVHRDYFADVRPSGQTPMALVGGTRYPAHTEDIAVGQNIAWGSGRDATPGHIVAEWMASPPHRAIILTGEYRDAGVAVTPALPSVLRAGKLGALYAVEFGMRRY